MHSHTNERMKLLKLLKRLAFGLLGAVMAVLVTATVLEKIYGTDFAAAHIYGAGWFAALWGALTLAALACLFRRKLWRRPAVLLLHLSFAVILAGASVTWLFGRQGTLHLRTGDPGATAFAGRDGSEQILPFRARLDDFRIEYYAGTRAPMDFVSLLTLTADDGSLHGEVGMNRILVFRNYRFYQSAYDEDGRGTTLSVSYDPWGIGITYAGYGLLLVSMLAFLCDRRGGFRRLLRSPALRKAALCLVLCTAAVQGARAADTLPQTLPREVAAELGDLYVYYNDRICPLQTLAKDFTVKLCGKSRYRGLTPEQVLSGWLFYYDDWKREPMIRIRSAGARRLLEVGGRYARLSDFRNRVNEYRLEGAAGRPAGEADEKFNIIGMVCTGSMLRIFPYTDPSDSLLRWASQVDGLPRELPHGQALFIGRAMNYVSELVVKRDWAGVAGVLRKIRSYQQKEGGAHMPSGLRFRAEKLYNRLDWSLPLAAAFILIGIGGFLDACRRMVRGRAFGAKTRGWLLAGVAAGGLYLTLMLALNRKVHRAYWRTRDGNFSLHGLMGFDMYGKTAGIVGTGKIARELIRILKGFGMKVLAYDIFPDAEYAAQAQVEYVTLDELYRRADIISLHCPLTDQTRYMINGDAIGKMKPGVILINTGRGQLIHTEALIEGLKEKKIGAAGLDVYEEEAAYFYEDTSDRIMDDDILARLLSFNNVIMTSHQGFFTREALDNIAHTTLQNINDFDKHRKLVNEVRAEPEKAIG